MISDTYEKILKYLYVGRLFQVDGISADIVKRIQVTQLSGWVRISFVTVPAGMIVTVALYSMYWSERTNPWVLSSFAGLLASYLALLHFCFSWTQRGREGVDLQEMMRRLLTIRFILGTSWAFGLIVMMTLSDPLQRALLYGISIGLISTAVFGGPVIYALSFWLPVTCGSFGELFATGRLAGVPILICLVAYAALTFCAILYFDRQLIERFVNMVRLERHAETIGILLRDFEESSSDWLWETDATLTMRHISPRFAEVSLRRPEQMEIGLFELLTGHPTVASFDPPDAAIATLRRYIDARAPFRELVVPVNIGPERRWWALTGKPLFNSNGEFTGYRGVGSDVTAAHRSRERIAYLARHDALTDLANRAGFNDMIAAALADCHRQKVALLCLDLDEFKWINDSYGHDVGDSVLRAVAQRIRGTLRTHDMAARLGGDEFAIILVVDCRDDAQTVARRLIENLSPPFACGDLIIKVGVSIGIAIAPEDGDDPDVLYRNADLALYRAKAAGRGTWRVFDAEMDRHLHEKRILQRDIRTALDDGELFVEYQPIVDLRTSEVLALEALVRWRHKERGIISPAEFVPIAEHSGLIGAIGTFVLTEAVALVRQLPMHIRIAVNLSPLQLRDDSLSERISDLLCRYMVSPDRIEFEVTESVMLETYGRSLENLRSLRLHGHRVAIDDFGTGYSSLSVLRGFPFDRLKIDRSFISDLEGEETEGPIVKAIISLGRALGISVTAEGVETERQATILREYRCASAQGFYFAGPLTQEQVLALLLPSGCTLPRRDAVHSADTDTPSEEFSGESGQRRHATRHPRPRLAHVP